MRTPRDVAEEAVVALEALAATLDQLLAGHELRSPVERAPVRAAVKHAVSLTRELRVLKHSLPGGGP